VGILTTWSYINTGQFEAFTVKKDGTLWSWGQNSLGQLGQNNLTDLSSPKQVGALTNWLNVASGCYGFALATKTNGTLWAWGHNEFGQAATGNVITYSSPKQVGSLTNWLYVCGSYNTSLAIKTNGTLWGWGGNSYGCSGLGNTTSYSSPKQIGNQTNWSKFPTNGGQFFMGALTI